MADFAQGNLLGRVVHAGDSTPVLLYEAKVDTEIMLITCAFEAAQSPVNLSLYHTLKGDASPDLADAIFIDKEIDSLTQGRVLGSSTMGAAIHMQVTDALYINANKNCNVSAYGVLRALTSLV